MAPTHFLAVIVITTLAATNKAHQQSMKLMTRLYDRAALCATDPPTTSARMSERMARAPEVVRCGMTCTSDTGCEHFNYVSTETNPCELYHYRPTNFDVSPTCQHYYTPGLQFFFSFFASCTDVNTCHCQAHIDFMLYLYTVTPKNWTILI